MDKRVEIQGHRGARALRPENTLPSFQAAVEAGADRLELDILMTKDGELVIYHDFSINFHLCTNLNGSPVKLPPPLIHSLTLSQLKQFDSGSKKNPLFPKQSPVPGTEIPTLQELFDLIKNLSHLNAKKIGLNLEMKRYPGHLEWSFSPSLFVKKLVDLVRKNGFSDRVYYSSFDPEMLSEVRKLDPKTVIAFLKEGEISDLVQIATRLDANIVSPEHIFIQDISFVRSLHKLGFKVITWTVNDLERSLELIKMEIDGIITDDPQKLIAHLKTQKN